MERHSTTDIANGATTLIGGRINPSRTQVVNAGYLRWEWADVKGTIRRVALRWPDARVSKGGKA